MVTVTTCVSLSPECNISSMPWAFIYGININLAYKRNWLDSFTLYVIMPHYKYVQ